MIDFAVRFRAVRQEMREHNVEPGDETLGWHSREKFGLNDEQLIALETVNAESNLDIGYIEKECIRLFPRLHLNGRAQRARLVAAFLTRGYIPDVAVTEDSGNIART